MFSRLPKVPARSHVDMSGISQVPRRSVPCLCPAPRPRSDRRAHGHWRSRRCCPRSNDSEGSSKRSISRLMRGFGTCCLRFKSDVATTHAKLASGWLARLYREGVEPSGSLQKVSDHILVPLFWIYPGATYGGFSLSTAGRLASRTVPSWVIGGLSLLPAFAVRHPVCIRPSCTSWSRRLSRTAPGSRTRSCTAVVGD